MSGRIRTLLSLLMMPLLQASVKLLPSVPNAPTPYAMQVDAAGNIYIAGGYVPATKQTSSAFVAKLAPGGAQVTYFKTLGGSFVDSATALAVGSDGSVYVTGNTNSYDFPIAGGGSPVSGNIPAGQGFFAKLDPSGALVYSTFILGPVGTGMTGIALDASANVYLTGIGGPGEPNDPTAPLQGFVLELNAALNKMPLSVYGYGGGLISADAQNNIYLAGIATATVTFGGTTQTLTLPPVTAGAFQTKPVANFCYKFGSGPGGIGGEQSCAYQYAAKLDPSGKPVWATYVTGSYGATPFGMSVDGAGNVLLAGTTNSDDYPVTAGAFQTAYAAGAPPLPPNPNGAKWPPPTTGFITKVNATGTALLWSSYFGGSFTDQVTGMAVAPNGDIVIAGQSGSSDLPGVAGLPDGCRPAPSQMLRFVSRVTADGSSAGPTQVITGAPFCTYFDCGDFIYDTETNTGPGSPLALDASGNALIAGSKGILASADFKTSQRVGCVVDAGDNIQLSAVAPGQIVTVFGTDLAPAAPFTPTGSAAMSTASFGVFFNGIAAPILYSSANQINLQVPYEIAGQSSVQMQMMSQETPLADSSALTLGVTSSAPSLFLNPAQYTSAFPGYVICGGSITFGLAAIALNVDGSLNDCAHPAAAGSAVTVFADGLGQVTPAQATGALAASATEVTPGISIDIPSSAASATTSLIPGWIDGVMQVRIQAPAVAAAGPAYVTVSSGGILLRDRLILIWVSPGS